MMLYIVIVYLWTAILLYLLLGGADFGAGIIELFTSRKNRGRTRNTMYQAIGPVWEANHMWLIIAIVILFVGFPKIYTTMSLHLHIPLLAMLLGIIARGTAFVYRNYDAVKDDMQQIYTPIFIYSSIITPFFLGIIAGSTVTGHIDTHATDFMTAYIWSWLSTFTVAVGLFTVSICAYLAAIFIIGETDSPIDRQAFTRKARIMLLIAVACGAAVFVAAHLEHIPLLSWIFGRTAGTTAIVAASVSLPFLWWSLQRSQVLAMRLLAGFEIAMVLFAATYQHFPRIVLLKGGSYLSLLEQQGEQKTIDALAWALLLGSIFILPFLFYLLYSFAQKSPNQGQEKR
ncbi:cytochrome bd-I ubiquinol oxidase subunit 2 apoprotein [bacterium A37T11]|nr:cytochrome bd-I ubiquinol oxidase subunit 2 apoprotein [bacterium A37T11]